MTPRSGSRAGRRQTVDRDRAGRPEAFIGSAPGRARSGSAGGVVVVGDDAWTQTRPSPSPRHGLAGAGRAAERRPPRAQRHHHLSVSAFPPRHPASAQPELVVSVGRPGISREIQALLRDRENGPSSLSLIRMMIGRTPAVRHTGGCGIFRRRRAAEVTLRGYDYGRRPTRPRGPHSTAFSTTPTSASRDVVRDVLRHLPDGALCVIGSSMPIRDAEVTMSPRRGLRVLCNRGLAGIDGTTSTAIGAAIAHQTAGGGRAYAIMGDLTFLHDLTGLSVAGRGGDRISPSSSSTTKAAASFRWSGIPPTQSVSTSCSPRRTPSTSHVWPPAWAGGIQRVNSPSELTADLTGAGPRILEVRTDRNVNAKLHQRLSAHVGQALDCEVSK